MASQALTRVSEPENRNDWYRVGIDAVEPPPRPRTIQALHNEHIYICNLLESMDEQLGMIAAGQNADFHLLLDIIDYMQSFPDRFHHPKEDLIYQRMALRDEGCIVEVQALLEEHKFLEKLAARFAHSIDEVHLLPTVLKKKHVGELGAEYVARMREHINKEEASILPLSIEVLREEDWFLIDQQSTPIHEIPIEHVLADNYTAMRRYVGGTTEKVANSVVLAEFLYGHALLEVAGGVSASLVYAGATYKRSAGEAWAAYQQACRSWFPLLLDTADEPTFQNPVRRSWRVFFQCALEQDGPEMELVQPFIRATRLYSALIGGRGKPI